MNLLLIEDRIIRKENFIQRLNIDLNCYKFLKQVSAEEYKDIKLSIKSGDTTLLSKFDVILTHKSAFTINEQDLLDSICKSIIYFSGGISQSFYTEYPVPCLHINSSDFYSPNLIEFLDYIEETGNIELLILQFGENWRLNLLLKVRDELAQLLYKNVNEDLYPTDFDTIFTNKISSIVSSEFLKSEIEELCNFGLGYNEHDRVNSLKLELNLEIQNLIHLIK